MTPEEIEKLVRHVEKYCQCAEYWKRYNKQDPTCPVHDIAEDIRVFETWKEDEGR